MITTEVICSIYPLTSHVVVFFFSSQSVQFIVNFSAHYRNSPRYKIGTFSFWPIPVLSVHPQMLLYIVQLNYHHFSSSFTSDPSSGLANHSSKHLIGTLDSTNLNIAIKCHVVLNVHSKRSQTIPVTLIFCKFQCNVFIAIDMTN